MLNIGKLAPGGEGYYLDTVASGVEDYYTGSGEAHGYWLGAGAAALELSGRVEPEVLRAVLGALDPATREPLTGRMSRRSVPGFDCTFRAPKSVSLLYGLGDVETALAVRDAHDTAVAAALCYLEQHAGFSRRGHGGADRVPVTGFAAAAFRHRTSRAGDPLLHTHVLVANLGKAGDDGKWRTLDGRSLYLHAKTAGYLYQAQLRIELSRRLGVAWREVRNGCADIEGVPNDVIRAFSQRRVEIEAHMQRRGETSAKAAQIAALATRKGKDRSVEPAALGAEWLVRAAALGFGVDQLAALTGRRPHLDADATDLVAVAEELAGPDGLTAHASTFCRRDVVRGWCERLTAGADVGRVLALADALLTGDVGAVVRLDDEQAVAQRLAADQVIRRGDGAVIAAAGDEPRYSTPELLASEQRAINSAVGRQRAGVAVAAEQPVDAALARRPTLAGEQAAMVRRLTTSGAGVDVVVGKAGAGKTFALDAAREAWQASGIRVVGCALAARAAEELHAGAGIDSYTIDALLIDLDRPQRWGGLAPGSVLVVDEAGMVGTRKLARLLDHAQQASAKVVLVGDHHQLPEIDAGGLFRGLVNRLPVIELTENRRQRAGWERRALDELRAGDPAAAVAAYSQAGRVVVGDSAEAAREQLVCDWWTARCDHAGPGEPGVMIAARVGDVEDLNDRARSRLATAGELTGPTLCAATHREFQAGDRIVCLRNDRRGGVVNGSRGYVTTVNVQAGTMTARLDDGTSIELPAAYVDAGHVAHGYAITGHKAQGMTARRAWILGSDSIYREWGYVALSRGRDSNRVYVVAGADDWVDEELHAHGGERAGDAVAGMVTALRRTRGQHLASDQTGDVTAEGRGQLRLPTSGRQRLHQKIEAIATSGTGDDERLQQERETAAEQASAIQRRLVAAQQRAAERKRVVRLLRRGHNRSADAEVARLRGDLEAWRRRVVDLDRKLSEFAAKSSDRTGTESRGTCMPALGPVDALTLRHAVEAAEFDPPDYVLATVGARPATPALRRLWRRGVQAIECYRTAWSVVDPASALGSLPADPDQRHAYDAALVAVQAAGRPLRFENSGHVVHASSVTVDHGIGMH